MKLRMREQVWIMDILLYGCLVGWSQGDGAHSHLLAPQGVWGVHAKYLNLRQNLLPSGNILIQGADLKVNIFLTTFFHTFGIGDHFPQALIMITPSVADARFTGDAISIEESIRAKGLSDRFVGIKLGLVGAPARGLHECAQHQRP